MQKYFRIQTDSNVGAYINNIVVKSRKADQRIVHLEKTFANLSRFKNRV